MPGCSLPVPALTAAGPAATALVETDVVPCATSGDGAAPATAGVPIVAPKVAGAGPVGVLAWTTEAAREFGLAVGGEAVALPGIAAAPVVLTTCIRVAEVLVL